MDDLQTNIECHNFSCLLPRILLEKLLPEPKPDEDGLKNLKKKFKGDKDKDKDNHN
jgi:hypothetical protein